MARTEAEIREMIKQYVNALEREISVKRVILYGSYAKGTATNDSDIDIAVESNDFSDHYLKEWQRLYRYVWKSGADPLLEPRPLLRDSEPFMTEEILKTGKVIYEADKETALPD
ncbi:nucleotidyltransferase domain-containing protein [Salicibibacter halophilus]|uniref:Nucleotidyltransferase domain-containing protein n=1 Tax=Salicibibacter halophilus TaxID=2502791 RepID=A0A514LFB4_9BACI|nr:nucleotidyltransferase domain-containing protein [Salicibibacter halophilus]QDI90534.1 nucleotidyltransferase domain-containing protein [Salicibibacter halophilus]